MDLLNSVTVVTGAAGGIGRACAKPFAAGGVDTADVDRWLRGLRKLRARVRTQR